MCVCHCWWGLCSAKATSPQAQLSRERSLSPRTEPPSPMERRKTEFQQSHLLLPPPGDPLLRFPRCFLKDSQSLKPRWSCSRGRESLTCNSLPVRHKKSTGIPMGAKESAAARELRLLHPAPSTAKERSGEGSRLCFMELDIP